MFGSGPGILDPITTAASAGAAGLREAAQKRHEPERPFPPGLTWHFGVPTVRKVGSCMQQMFEGSVILGKVNFQLPLDAVSDGIFLGLLGNPPRIYRISPKPVISEPETPHGSFLMQ